MIGISLGGQPIIGFNMGAGNVERVNETIRTITKIVLAIGTVFFLIFEIIICDLVTLAFSIVIFVKADKTLTPKEGEGFIAIFKLIIFLFYLVPSIG